MINRVLQSRWNVLLLLIAVFEMFLCLPELPTNPRDGWSTVGVWVHGYHPGAPPGTPYVFGPHRAFIWEDDDGHYTATLTGRGTGKPGDVSPAGFVEYNIMRLREGLLAPTRETWSRDIRFYAMPTSTADDASRANVPPERHNEAIDAIIDLQRRLIADDPDTFTNPLVNMVGELQRIQAGEMVSISTALPNGLRSNVPLFVFMVLAAIALPGTIRAVDYGARRVATMVRHSRDHRPRCPGCAYDLTGIERGRCPECGCELS